MVLAHRERGLATIAVDVQEARLRKDRAELGQVVDGRAAAFDPAASVEPLRELLEQIAGVRRHRLRGQRRAKRDDLVIERVRAIAETGQHRHQDPRQRVVAPEAGPAGAERIRDLRDLVAAPQHRRHEGLLRADEVAEVRARDGVGTEPARRIESVEELEHGERLRRLGEHARQQRRAAATRPDDEPIHAPTP